MSRTRIKRDQPLLDLALPSEAWVAVCLAVLIVVTFGVGLYPSRLSGELFLFSLLFCWMALPGNLLCNLGILNTCMPSWESLAPTVFFWAYVALYWIGAITLVIRLLRTRRLVFLLVLGVILMLSAHGCQQNLPL